MPTGTGHKDVFATDRSLGNPPAPRGRTAHNRNLLNDEDDLAFPAQLDAVETACFDKVDLTPAMSFSVTLPQLL